MLPFIKLEGYVSEGGTIRVDEVRSADSPEEGYQEYYKMINEKDDDGNKRFVNTRVHIAVYKQVDNPTEFFNQFKAT